MGNKKLFIITTFLVLLPTFLVLNGCWLIPIEEIPIESDQEIKVTDQETSTEEIVSIEEETQSQDINEEKINELEKEETEDKEEVQPEESQEPTRDANNPPVINQIILPPNNMLVGTQYDISATATDPDGDILTYAWSVSGGTINDFSANPMIWTTPSSDGTYDITLLIDDGNGGTDARTESVTVYPLSSVEQSMEVPFTAMTVVKDVTYLAAADGPVDVGDYGATWMNQPSRIFISFDITGLVGATIVDATMELANPSQQGDPYDHLITAFWVSVINMRLTSSGKIDFDPPSKPLGEYPDPNIVINDQALIDAVQTAINNGRDKFHIMIHHRGWQTNHNDTSDSIRYNQSDIHLDVTYTN